jgi:hypothetical protein
MRQLFTNKTLTLASGQAISGIANAPRTVRIMSGRVWITMEGVSHDYWLHAGDELTLIPGALTVMEADRADSRIEFATWASDSGLSKLLTHVRHLSRLAQRFGRSRNAGVDLSQRAC